MRPRSDLRAASEALAPTDLEWLHRLLGEWQLLADLSFADLLLWLPGDGTNGRVAQSAGQTFVCAGQMRPTTGPTAYQDDRVGALVTAAEHPQLAAAFTEGRIAREGDPVWVGDVPVRLEAIPVRSPARRVIAVVGRDTNLAAVRTPSRLEIAYLQTANDLAEMIAEGVFPSPDLVSVNEPGPRVGDGLIRLDREGVVEFASPNALSAYRRLGLTTDLVGEHLTVATSRMTPVTAPLGEPVADLTRGRLARTGDVETPTAVVQIRAIPLRPGGRHIGAAVLVHDVTELRRRERALLSKDATIREIHHRVKNNLQTVAALLRLQARRLDSAEARAALDESVRRVSSIAVVHETLSLTLDDAVPFDTIADRLMAGVAEMASHDGGVQLRRDGSFGVLPARVATPLAMALTELWQNAVEHAFPERPADQGAGTVLLTAGQHDGQLVVQVDDDGVGLPADFPATQRPGLGLQIVRTLVESELGGRLTLRAGPERGTRALVEIPLG